MTPAGSRRAAAKAHRQHGLLLKVSAPSVRRVAELSTNPEGDGNFVLERGYCPENERGLPSRRRPDECDLAVIFPDLSTGCSMVDMADPNQLQDAWDFLGGKGG